MAKNPDKKRAMQTAAIWTSFWHNHAYARLDKGRTIDAVVVLSSLSLIIKRKYMSVIAMLHKEGYILS